MLAIQISHGEKQAPPQEFIKEEIAEIIEASKDAADRKNMSPAFTTGVDVVNYLWQ